jgi:hypothetical protein
LPFIRSSWLFSQITKILIARCIKLPLSFVSESFPTPSDPFLWYFNKTSFCLIVDRAWVSSCSTTLIFWIGTILYHSILSATWSMTATLLSWSWLPRLYGMGIYLTGTILTISFSWLHLYWWAYSCYILRSFTIFVAISAIGSIILLISIWNLLEFTLHYYSYSSYFSSYFIFSP